jgi:hypothetical protein
MDTIRRHRHLTVAATATTAVAAWTIVAEDLGVQLGVRFPHSAATVVGLGQTVGASVGATLVGWVALGLLERRMADPVRSWTATAIAVAMASLALPLAFATTTAAVIGLAAIHLAVAATAITGLRRSAVAARARSATPATLRHDARLVGTGIDTV